MSTTASYVSAAYGSGATASQPVIMTKSNSVAGAQFLTAANPSSSNGGLGSNYYINSGSGVVAFVPGQALTTAVATGATTLTSWAGSCIAADPVTGQTYSSYSITLPSSDTTTPLFSAGSIIITNAAVTITNMNVQIMTTQQLTVATGATNYFTVTSLQVTAYVPTVLNTIISDTVIRGVNTATKFQVQTAANAPLLTASTTGNSVIMGSSSLDTLMGVFGSLSVAGGNSTQKLHITADPGSGPVDFLLLNTIGGELTLSNLDTTTNGGLVLTGSAQADKFVVYNPSDLPILTVNSTSQAVLIEGANNTPKFVVNDSTSRNAFSVTTDTSAGQASQRVNVVTIAPIVATATVGTAGLPFATIYAANNAIQPSDSRIKADQRDLDSAACLAAVKKLQGKSFIKTRASLTGGRELGLIAQNLEEALGELEHCAVMTVDDAEFGDLKMVRLDQLWAVFAEAIKAIDAKIVRLESRLPDNSGRSSFTNAFGHTYSVYPS